MYFIGGQIEFGRLLLKNFGIVGPFSHLARDEREEIAGVHHFNIICLTYLIVIYYLEL